MVFWPLIFFKKQSLKSILQSEQETYDLNLTLRLQFAKNLFKSSVTWLPTAASVLLGQSNWSQWPKSNLYVQRMFLQIIFAGYCKVPWPVNTSQ